VSERRPAALLAAALLLALLAGRARAQDVYPADISPPAGTRYPCALTALPRELAGVPETDRAFINRTYARILRATQAKLVALKALEEQAGPRAAVATYLDATGALASRQRADAVPAGLEPFQQDVLAAIELQRVFFGHALELRERGQGLAEAYHLPEGRQASAHLVAAWSRMQARYPAWSAQTRDSVYHHLCALDLF
jgi:hypothetical protein